MNVLVKYKHYNPYLSAGKNHLEKVFKNVKSIKHAKQKLYNRLNTLKKRVGINPYRLSEIYDIECSEVS